MKAAWDTIRKGEQNGAIHKTKGYQLDRVDLSYMIQHAREELVEFEETVIVGKPDISELADIFGCIIHIAVRMRWSPQEVEYRLIEKLNERFLF